MLMEVPLPLCNNKISTNIDVFSEEIKKTAQNILEKYLDGRKFDNEKINK